MKTQEDWRAWLNDCFMYYPAWVGSDIENGGWLSKIDEEVPWSVHKIQMFGQWLDSPRQSCWMADEGISYAYAGNIFNPVPWTPIVRELKNKLADDLGLEFNSVLLNRYANGEQYMGWHSDDEPELGHQPTIASISLGHSRRFLVRSKDKCWKSEYLLKNRDLLIMQKDSQEYSQHALPKTKKVKDVRINLTFRQIIKG